MPTLELISLLADAAIVTADLPSRRIVLPCVVNDTDLELRLYTQASDLVVQGPFRIPEPTGPLFTDYASIDLAVIPGMAFDHEGNRLGRGRGYYDRLLSNPAFQHTPKIGLCYDFQHLATIPSDSHDIKVDAVICCPTKK